MPTEGIEKKWAWEDELDSLQFVDEDTGYTCFIRRHPELKHLCGYVFVPNDLIDKAKELLGEMEDIINIHGGITFTQYIKGYPVQGIDPKTYAIGFDCGHAWDFVPYMYKELYPDDVTEDKMEEYQRNMGVTYKDINFVKNECRKLAKQLHEILTGEKEKCQEN